MSFVLATFYDSYRPYTERVIFVTKLMQSGLDVLVAPICIRVWLATIVEGFKYLKTDR